MASLLLDLTLLGAVDWSRNPCRHCLRPKADHTGPFLSCPDSEGPEPGEQMWLDDAPGGRPKMSERDLATCVGGPWDGERAAISLNGEVLVHLTAGSYLLEEDRYGAPFYQWHPVSEARHAV